MLRSVVGIVFLLLFVVWNNGEVVSSVVLEQSNHAVLGRRRALVGWNSKTHTIETDDDSVDGGTHTHERTVERSNGSKPKVSSPYGVTKSTGTTATTVSTTPTVSDVVTSESNDDDSNMTAFMDMLDVVHRNNYSESKSTLVLPSEKEPTETWTIAIVALFSSMAITLCAVTAWRRWCRNKRRDGYQEVSNLVV
jgi:hypothetical protein